MDWSNERYVRLYTRDTKNWLRFGWEGQALLMALLRKVDRSGRLDGIEDSIMDLSLLTGLPDFVISAGLPRLQKTETVLIANSILILPNFMAAQESSASDAERQRRSREKRRAEVIETSGDNNTIELIPTLKTEKTKPEITPEFIKFWIAYPNKKKRADAEKAWKTLLKKNELPAIDILLASIEEHRKHDKDWTEDFKGLTYIPAAGPYLRGKRWEDELKPSKPVAPPPERDEEWERAMATFEYK